MLELVFREALRLGHNYVGTEHLLLGLLADDEIPAAQRIGVTHAAAEEHITAAVAALLAARAAERDAAAE